MNFTSGWTFLAWLFAWVGTANIAGQKRHGTLGPPVWNLFLWTARVTACVAWKSHWSQGCFLWRWTASMCTLRFPLVVNRCPHPLQGKSRIFWCTVRICLCRFGFSPNSAPQVGHLNSRILSCTVFTCKLTYLCLENSLLHLSHKKAPPCFLSDLAWRLSIWAIFFAWASVQFTRWAASRLPLVKPMPQVVHRWTSRVQFSCPLNLCRL